jgi:hypothetical protein
MRRAGSNVAAIPTMTPTANPIVLRQRVCATGSDAQCSGNCFQGTDVIGNTLYVMVYAPDTVAQK